MILKYNLNISDEIIDKDLKRIINQIYRLLPLREEKEDWQKPLQTIIEQLVGLQKLFLSEQETFLVLLCKLEGMKILIEQEHFQLYRRTIFECLNLLSEMRNNVYRGKLRES